MHAAAKCGKAEIVSELLNEGVDMDVCDINRETPLLSAAKAGNSDAAKALLAAGADIKTRDHGGCSALDWAGRNGDAEIVTAILMHGAEANSCDLLGRTALHRASASPADTEDAIKALVDGGADTEFPNELGLTPLSDAARRFDRKNVLALLRNEADPNTRCSHGNTPLHEVCRRRFFGLETVVDLLLRWGADEKAHNDNMLVPENVLDLENSVDFGCSDAEITRTRRLLEFAEKDRIWRRRGLLLMLRSRAIEEARGDSHDRGGIGGGGGGGNGDGDNEKEAGGTGRAGCLRRRTGESAAGGGGGAGGCGSDARNAARGLSLMKMLPQIPECVFRTVVCFL